MTEFLIAVLAEALSGILVALVLTAVKRAASGVHAAA